MFRRYIRHRQCHVTFMKVYSYLKRACYKLYVTLRYKCAVVEMLKNNGR